MQTQKRVLLAALVSAGLAWATAGYGLAQTLPPPRPVPQTGIAHQAPQIGLEELTRVGLERNPRLGQAAFSIDVARGRAVQAGLYPNPTVSVILDELGDRTGPGGVNTLPLVSQEIVTAGKLRLSRAAATKEVDQATLALMTQRYTLLSNIRQAYFEVLTLQNRVEILGDLVKLAEQSVATSRKLLEAKLIARLDLLQLETELERFRAEEEAAIRELPGAYRRLAAVVGVSGLPVTSVTGNLELPLPDYELERTVQYVLSVHPELRSAQVEVERAQLLLRRAQVEPIPNVTVGAGYVRQNQNRSDDWTINVSVPVPVWNRNQGTIRAIQAQVGEAVQGVGRVENELVDRVASAFRDFAAARQRAARYASAVLPRARETYELSVKAYKGGQFEYLRVLEAQRALAQARIEYLRALGDSWRAASVLSGLTLEDEWPLCRAAGGEVRLPLPAPGEGPNRRP